jgi:spore germination protein GerM
VAARARRIAPLAALAAAVLTGGACGLPQDDEPQIIARDDLPAELFEQPTTSEQPSPEEGTSQVVFLLQTIDEQTSLIPVEVTVPADADADTEARSVITTLVEDPPIGEGDSLTSAIPANLEVLGVRRDGDVLVIDLAGLAEAESTGLRLAVAQLVFTATALEDISAVQFLDDGTFTEVPLDEGSAEPGATVMRSDFPTLFGQTDGATPQDDRPG